VKENTEELIEETTRNAFSTDAKDPSTALKVLIAMKGIGPATASLLLSVNNCEEVPFFSDVSLHLCIHNPNNLQIAVLMTVVGALQMADVGRKSRAGWLEAGHQV
jgi:hypothetical protein